MAFSLGNQHAGFAAVVTETTLLTVGGVPIFDDIGALASIAPVYDSGSDHSSEGVK